MSLKVWISGTTDLKDQGVSITNWINLGRDTRSGDGTPYKGLMSDFRIYATTLSSDDILKLYNTPITLNNNGTLLTSGEFVEGY